MGENKRAPATKNERTGVNKERKRGREDGKRNRKRGNGGTNDKEGGK